MIAFETVCMMGIGSFMGYFMWGLSGFGAGLTVVCVWSFFKSIGFNAGPIQLIIAADSISNIIVSIPFLIMTQSFKFGDFGIFGPIVVFRNSANYFGAYLFHSLNEQLLELIIGPVLLFLVILKYVPIFWNACMCCLVCRGEKMKLVKNKSDFNISGSLEKNQDEIQSQNGIKVKIDHTQQLINNKSQKKQDSSCQKSEIINIAGKIIQCLEYLSKVIYKLFTCQYQIRKFEIQDSLDFNNVTSSFRHINFEIKENNQVEIIYSTQWIRSAPVLCISGIVSGVMGAMVGIPGPPLMYAFQFLQIPKNAARANASIANVLNFRAIFYFIFGSLQFEHWQVYMIVTFCAICGLITGNILSQSLTTQSYHHLLMLLVSLAGSMLILRGIGVIID
eukprot:TRINITY_DN5095_c0_g1_i2.p1 TRINITY_DN5095_c0_g1~~TRINITY_DN5095_c0_g1_i2.p1  ORF type:complete len:391 (+),score=27.82 TRINITY_DN5095_c0_g1_i2:128-1300(+)